MRDSASFRDKSGSVFYEGDSVFRSINYSYKEHYELLLSSGLYECLTSNGSLLSHIEVEHTDEFYKVIKPEKIGFISYPYEWSFNELKDAAILTLDIQLQSLKFGMSLKDASAYNIQFRKGKPVFIDTLSFEKYEENSAWKAFGQFTKHFLGPLVLMKYTSNELNKILKNYIDGVPVDILSKLLPIRSYFNINVLLSIHLQARYIKRAEKNASLIQQPNISIKRLEAMLLQLKQFIEGLNPKKASHWFDYYDTNTYLQNEDLQKKQLIELAINEYKPENVWDLGCNTGVYSILAAKANANVMAIDSDHDSVNGLYDFVNKNQLNILPLVMDFSNPSPSLGWAENERKSFSNRGPSEMVLALALIHHLRITAGIPFIEIAKWLNTLVAKVLVIEYIPKTDSQVSRLLLNREDVFDDYTLQEFENIFSSFFKLVSKELITKSGRLIFIYEK